MKRRMFLQTMGAGTASLALRGVLPAANPSAVPSYLRGYEQLYAKDPREAARAWFKEAKFGLFMHYGLYSLIGEGEWVMLRKPVPLEQYVTLKDEFKADKFDADFITDLALEAGMKYVNITSRHHDGFSLFATGQNDYHVKASPANRDLIGELAEQCQKKGLGLFLYYSYALDWWHPYFLPRSAGWEAYRPPYASPPAQYRYQQEEDFGRYLEFVDAQLRELLTGYGPLAGIWFDPIMGYYARPDLFPIDQTYALVRSLQPQTLISFKQGATGTEDFAAPERSGHSLADRVRARFGEASAAIAEKAWNSNRNKHNEICDTLQPRVWGYNRNDTGKHLGPEELWQRLARAFGQNCNLLMNTGPLPDGSIHPDDVRTLRAVGKRIRAEGYPAPEKHEA